MINAMSLVLLVCCIQIIYISPYANCQRKFGESRTFKSWYSKGECKADAREPWSYRGENGPDFWSWSFPTCNGDAQSPISISSRTAVHNPRLSKLAMNNYDIPLQRARIENNGRTVEVTPTDGVERTIIVEGSIYRLAQLHFHWGDSYHQGSEHTLNGIQYTMELHFVHRNANNQIAVVGVFFQEQNYRNAELQTIIKAFPKVMFRDTSSQLTADLNLDKLLPANPSSFYRYPGSLTTPGCDEGVTWSVLTKPLPVGKKQMAEFRKLYSVRKADASWKCKLINNYRPVQRLNNRTVYISS